MQHYEELDEGALNIDWSRNFWSPLVSFTYIVKSRDLCYAPIGMTLVRFVILLSLPYFITVHMN